MAYIGSSPTKVVSRQSANIFTYQATANQTAFTGADANGNTLACTPSDLMVHMNGIKLEESDYTATTTTVTLGSGAAAGDEVTITAFLTFESADHYTKSAADTRYVNASGDTMTGAFNVSAPVTIDAGNGNQLTLDNGGERYTQINYQSNGTQAAAIWYDGTNNELVNQATSGNGWKVKTGGTADTLCVDSSGRVTTPYQPYAIMKFQSGNDGAYNQATTANKIVKPQNVLSNNGSHYSTSTGLFTCPVAGVYTVQCSGNVYNSNAGTWLRPTVYKNGSPYLYHYENTQMTWHNYHFTTPVVCAANDTLGVWMGTQSGNGGGFDVNNYSMLSFMLVA